MVGFEPTNTRVKVWCLTTWRHPNIGKALSESTLRYELRYWVPAAGGERWVRALVLGAASN